jgi:hypothetical protein
MTESNQPFSFTVAFQQQADVPKAIEPGTGYEIPVEGSLGLLALGAVGLLVWRQVRAAAGAKAQEELAAQNTEKNE